MGRNAAYPRPSGSGLPAATAHVCRSPGMGGITQIPKNSRSSGPIQGLRRATTERTTLLLRQHAGHFIQAEGQEANSAS